VPEGVEFIVRAVLIGARATVALDGWALLVTRALRRAGAAGTSSVAGRRPAARPLRL
jgi:hypothetical protein